MVQRYEQTRKLQWYKRGAAYKLPNEVLPKVKSANSMIWTWKRALPWRCLETSLFLVFMQWGCLLLILLT